MDAQEPQTNGEKPRDSAEKPKKALTPAQLKNLERMRLKKLAKSEAKKMISIEKTAHPDVPANSGGQAVPAPVSELPEDVRRALLDISGYISEKRERKKRTYAEAIEHEHKFEESIQMYPQWRICRR